MKKLLVALIIIACFGNAQAQKTYLVGGVNLANITSTNAGQTEKNNRLATFNAGVLTRFKLLPVAAIETGLLLDGRGAKATTYFNGGNDYVKSTFNPLYLEIPLNFIYKIVLPKSGLFIHGGPYIAAGIAGKSKTESKIGPLFSTSENDIKFSNDDPFTSQQDDAAYNKLKRFDFGLNFGGGLDLKKVIIRANYGLGLAKINSTESNNTVNDKNKYRTISVSLGIAL